MFSDMQENKLYVMQWSMKMMNTNLIPSITNIRFLLATNTAVKGKTLEHIYVNKIIYMQC